jgi:hypothetical protein
LASHGWTFQGVFIISTIAVLTAMAADIALTHKVTWISGFVLFAVSLLSAWNVRRNDFTAAVSAPPIVWLLGIETVGQLGKMPGGSFVRKQIIHLAYGLANNAIWIVLSVFMAIVITTVRRGRHS